MLLLNGPKHTLILVLDTKEFCAQAKCVGTKWGLVSNLGHIELEPEFFAIEAGPGIIYFVEYKPDHWGCMTLRKRFFKQ